jgi:hypothetical protein
MDLWVQGVTDSSFSVAKQSDLGLLCVIAGVSSLHTIQLAHLIGFL